MSRVVVIAVVAAGIAVAIADALIKRIATPQVWPSWKDPLMLLVLGLYAAQVCLFLYNFGRGIELGIAGNLQMACYAITTVGIGWLALGETLTWTQGSGIALSFLGILLMNWR